MQTSFSKLPENSLTKASGKNIHELSGSMGSRGGGNNSPPRKRKRKRDERKRQNLGKKFVVVWNNYPDGAFKFCRDQLDQDCTRCQFQTEVGDQGTKHIQGYVEFAKRVRPTEKYAMKGTIGEKLCFLTARGSAMDNAIYTGKEGSDGWDGVWRHTKNMPRPLVKVTYKMLRPKQQAIADEFKEFEDPLWGRNIHWFWEPDGNWGKTTIVKYLVDQDGAIMCGGNARDCMYMVRDYVDNNGGEGPKTVIWVLPRTTENYKISYTAIEQVKDGVFASPKFKGGMCRYNCPWVIVFANCEPFYESLTEDRWRVTRVDQEI